MAGAYAALDQAPGLNSVVQTPRIDRIAGSGVLFRHAFVSAPSCTPCRSSLLSGQHFWRTGRGAILQGAVWDPTFPAFPLLLKDSGYHIGKTFKVWSPGIPVDAPFGGQAHSFEKAGRRFNQFSQQVTRMVAEGQELAAAKETLYAEVPLVWQKSLGPTTAAQAFSFATDLEVGRPSRTCEKSANWGRLRM